MLEPVLVYYLNKYLGTYVEGLDADSLRVSVWAGDVVLKNLKLRPEALQGLNLPITVRGGVLGTLRLKVWRCAQVAPRAPKSEALTEGSVQVHD
jgi:vacuolar protein sorting-associated protein 13A/C